MIVADTNIITYLVIAGDKTEQARLVKLKDQTWMVPVLWQHEFINVLSTHVKQGILTIPQAKTAWTYSNRILSQTTYEVDMENALQLSVEENISAYDAQFIILAKKLGCPFLTKEKKLQKTFSEAQSMQDFLAN